MDTLERYAYGGKTLYKIFEETSDVFEEYQEFIVKDFSTLIKEFKSGEQSLKTAICSEIVDYMLGRVEIMMIDLKDHDGTQEFKKMQSREIIENWYMGPFVNNISTKEDLGAMMWDIVQNTKELMREYIAEVKDEDECLLYASFLDYFLNALIVGCMKFTDFRHIKTAFPVLAEFINALAKKEYI